MGPAYHDSVRFSCGACAIKTGGAIFELDNGIARSLTWEPSWRTGASTRSEPYEKDHHSAQAHRTEERHRPHRHQSRFLYYRPGLATNRRRSIRSSYRPRDIV